MRSLRTDPNLLDCGWKRRLQAQMPRRRPARAARRCPCQSQASLMVQAILPLMMALVESSSRETPDNSLTEHIYIYKPFELFQQAGAPLMGSVIRSRMQRTADRSLVSLQGRSEGRKGEARPNLPALA